MRTKTYKYPREKSIHRLVEKISKELNLTNCWVCGNTQMAEVWPWEGISLKQIKILRWKKTEQKVSATKLRGREQWKLKSNVIGEECICRKGKMYKTVVGETSCKCT